MLAKAIELGELAVEDPARALVNLYTWVSTNSEPKARSMAAMRAFDLPKDSAARDARRDRLVGRAASETITPPVVKFSKARKAPDLDDEARERIMHAESIMKLLARGRRRRAQAGDPVRAHLSASRRSITPARRSSSSSSAGRARRRRRSCGTTSRTATTPAYLHELGYDPDHSAGGAAREALGPPGRAERRCPQAPDRGEPAPGGQHRQEVHRPRHELPGPDPGGQHRPDPRGREVRLRARASSSAPTPPGGFGRRSRAPSPTRPARSASRSTWWRRSTA